MSSITFAQVAAGLLKKRSLPALPAAPSHLTLPSEIKVGMRFRAMDARSFTFTVERIEDDVAFGTGQGEQLCCQDFYPLKGLLGDVWVFDAELQPEENSG